MLKVLDLFSGIGGFSKGFEATNFFETISFVENEPYCQAVLKHHWPEVPILGDIKNVKAEDLPTRPDVICGGFPCQPFSQAGKQKAQDDARHLWPEMFRLIRECRPTWVVGENVVGLIRLGLDEVLADLESEGYSTRTFNIPACSVGAPHLRQRLWIVAHSDSESEPDGSFDGNAGQRQLGFEFVADTKRGRRRQNREQRGLDKVSRSGSHAKLPIKKSSPDVADSLGGSQTASHGSDSDNDGSHREKKHKQNSKHGETKLRDKQVCKLGSMGKDVADSYYVGNAQHDGLPSIKVSGGLLNQSEKQKGKKKVGKSERTSGASAHVADSDRDDRGRGRSTKSSKRKSRMEHWSGGECDRPEEWWEVEPSVGRLVDGLPNRVPQLRALGNSIIPQIAEKIGQAIKETYDVYK